MHLFVRSELAARDLRICFGEVGAFLGRQLNNGLLLAGYLEKQTRKLVLHLRGEGAHAINRTFKQFGHD